MATAFFSSSTCWRLSCSSSRAISSSRFWNSAFSLVCARIAGAESRSTRSVLTKPMRLLGDACRAGWASAGSANSVSAAAARRKQVIKSFSEVGSDGELYLLRLVLAPGVDRVGIGDLQRPERRRPVECEAGRIAQRIGLVGLVEDLAAVDEPGQAQQAVLRRARHGELQLGAAVQLAVAADDVAGAVARAEGEGAVAAHRAGTAAVEVLEERQRLVAEPAGVADIAVEHQRQVARHRAEPLVLVDQAVELQIAARHFAGGVDHGAGIGLDHAVARVAAPSRGDGGVGVGGAEGLGEIQVA